MTEGTNPYIVDLEEFEREGLTPAAPYHWRFESMTEGEKAIWVDDEPTDETYSVINGVLEAFEKAVYDNDGNFDGVEELDPPLTRKETFKITGTGAAKIRSAYKTVTGRALSGNKVEEPDGNGGVRIRYRGVDLIAAAQELIGGDAWNNIFHSDSTSKYPSRDLLTNTFRNKPPQRIRVAEKTEEEATL